MLLPRGVTGFWGHREQAPTATDGAAFRGHCHEAARRAGGRVLAVTRSDSGGPVRNFAVGLLSLPAGEVAVVLNAHHPLVAFADPPTPGEGALRFRDCPLLAEVFRSFGVYEVLAVAELERPPYPTALGALSKAERKQVASWKPARLGDVAYNWWD